MEDNIYSLKSDLQQCVANNIDTLDSNYRLFLFEGDELNFVKSFGCFETLKIKPCGSLMRFTGKLAEDLKFTNDEMVKIKQNAWKKNVYDMTMQMKESEKSFTEKESEKIAAETEMLDFLEALQSLKDNDIKYRPAKKYEKLEMKALQLRLKEMGLDLEYEEHEEMLMLSGNFTSLEFDKKELRTLAYYLSNGVDVFLIAPVYENQENDNVIYLNEDEENCTAIRIMMGIYLEED